MAEHDQIQSGSAGMSDDKIDTIESVEDLGLELVDKLPTSHNEDVESEVSIDEFQIANESSEEVTPTLDDLGIAISSENKPQETDSHDEWFMQQFGQTLGPFPYEHLVGLVEEGALSSDDQIRRGTTGPWIEAGSIEGLLPEEEDFELGGGVEIKEGVTPENSFEVVGGAGNRLMEKSLTPLSRDDITATTDNTEGSGDFVEGESDEPIDFESLPDVEPESQPSLKQNSQGKKAKRKARKDDIKDIVEDDVDDIIDDVLNAPAASTASTTGPASPAPVNPALPPKPTTSSAPSIPTPKTVSPPTPSTSAPTDSQTPASFQPPTPTTTAYKPPPPPKRKSSGGSIFSGIGNPFSGMSAPSVSIDPKTIGAIGAVAALLLGIYFFPMLGGTNDQEIYNRFQEIHASVKSGNVPNKNEIIDEIDATVKALVDAGAGAAKPKKQNLMWAGKICLLPMVERGALDETLDKRFQSYMDIVKTHLDK